MSPAKSFKRCADRLQSPALVELQDHVPAWFGIEPEVAAGGLALHLRIEHPHRRLVHLQVAAGRHGPPHRVVERTQPPGDRLDPLHHLLARDHQPVPLLELLRQSVKGQMIVIADQHDVDRQADPQSALRDQAGRQRRDRDPRFSAPAGPFAPDRAPPDQFGGDQLDLLADLLADAPHFTPAVRAPGLVRLQDDGLGFKVHRQRMAGARRRFSLSGAGSALLRLGLEHLDADRARTPGLVLEVSPDLLQLLALFLGQPFRFRTKELTLELLDPGLGLLELFAQEPVAPPPARLPAPVTVGIRTTVRPGSCAEQGAEIAAQRIEVNILDRHF